MSDRAGDIDRYGENTPVHCFGRSLPSPDFTRLLMSSTPSSPEITALRKQLVQYSCLTVSAALPADEAAAVRAGLLQFNEWSDYQTLGVCADTLAAGKAALEQYVAALSRPIQLELGDRPGPVYLKFNTLKGAWYLDDYSGPSRGVLVSFHASEPEFDPVNGTYGPFPLDLFEP